MHACTHTRILSYTALYTVQYTHYTIHHTHTLYTIHHPLYSPHYTHCNILTTRLLTLVRFVHYTPTPYFFFFTHRQDAYDASVCADRAHLPTRQQSVPVDWYIEDAYVAVDWYIEDASTVSRGGGGGGGGGGAHNSSSRAAPVVSVGAHLCQVHCTHYTLYSPYTVLTGHCIHDRHCTHYTLYSPYNVLTALYSR
jgi:hypothetical protein